MRHAAVDVTVVIVTFQSEAWISRCLSSVEEHAGCTTETIVVDNASSDGTIAASLCGRTLLRHKKNARHPLVMRFQAAAIERSRSAAALRQGLGGA